MKDKITTKKRPVGELIAQEEKIASRENLKTKYNHTAGQTLGFKNFYEHILENIDNGILVTDKHDVIYFVNEPMARAAGIPKESILGAAVLTDFSEETLQYFRPYYLKAKETLQIVSYDFINVVTPVGRQSYQSGILVPMIEDGKFDGMICTVYDVTKHKEAEEVLRESEDKFKHVFDYSIIGKSITLPSGEIHVNKACCEMLGYSQEELLNRKWQELTYPDDIETTQRAIDSLLSGEKDSERFIKRFIHKNGSIVWVDLSSSLRKDKEGKPLYLMTALSDITERKQAEEDLRKSEEFMTTIFDHSPHPMWISDNRGVLIRINQSCCDLLNINKEDVVGKYNILHDNVVAKQGLMPLVQNVFLKGEKVRFEIMYDTSQLEHLELQRRAFAVLDTSISPIKDASGNVTNAIIQHIDITPRRRAEEELRESRRRLSDIIEFLPDATFVIDRNGTVLAWNRAIEAMTGVKAEEMLGKGNYEYSLPFYGERKPILIDLALHHDPEREKEYTAIRRTGDIIFGESYTPNLSPGNIHLSATASLLRDSNGEIIAAIECIRNNTERKKLEAQLQQAQKMEAIGTLAGGIAHDFNNLLMAIQGNTSLMLMNTDSGDPRYEKLRAIENQVVTGAGLTKQLLGFARVGKYELKPVDLNEVVEKSSTMFGRTKKEILIHKKYEQALWAVEADTSQMEQVLMNIYVNAWQAIPGEGHIYLETANLFITEDDEKSSYLKPGRYAKISVTDTGVGMNEKTKARIFEPFFTTKEMGRGTGLGLAMVYGIVTGHNGYVTVYSEEGKGTTFNIYLPASEKEALKDERPAEAILKGRETILLVDDEEIIIDVMKEMLESLGYHVLIAIDGREALKIYERKKNTIDLVILDMIMPEMGGGEIFDRLKRVNPEIKVILSSGYSLNGEALGIMTRGCNGFIQKPATITELSQKIRSVLGQ